MLATHSFSVSPVTVGGMCDIWSAAWSLSVGKTAAIVPNKSFCNGYTKGDKNTCTWIFLIASKIHIQFISYFHITNFKLYKVRKKNGVYQKFQASGFVF